MAVTLDKNSAVGPSVVSGTYAGTTAAQTIEIGFRPSWVIGYNQTDGDTVYIWHNSSLTNYVSIVLAAATTTAAITLTDHGFVLPASDTVANENTKTYVFIAGR
jgi:hypothetical protein